MDGRTMESCIRIQKQQSKVVGQKANYVTGLFSQRPNKHDGFIVADCINERARICLEFLTPVMFPEKPQRLMVKLANTLLGAGPRKMGLIGAW